MIKKITVDTIASIEDYDKYIKPQLDKNPKLNEIYINNKHFVVKGSTWEDECWYERSFNVRMNYDDLASCVNPLKENNPISEKITALAKTNHNEEEFLRFDKETTLVDENKHETFIPAGCYALIDYGNDRVIVQYTKEELENRFDISEKEFPKVELLANNLSYVSHVKDITRLNENYDKLCSIIFKGSIIKCDYLRSLPSNEKLDDEFNYLYSAFVDTYLNLADELDESMLKVKNAFSSKDLEDVDTSLAQERYSKYCEEHKKEIEDNFNEILNEGFQCIENADDVDNVE